MRQSLRRRFVPRVLLALLLVTLLGCQSQPNQSAAPAAAATTGAGPGATTETLAVAAETIKVGISASLTGPGARVGMNVERFIRMSIDDVNRAGGVKVGNKTYRFEAITADDKLTGDGGRDAATYLALSQKVKFILGATQASIGGAQAVSEPNKVLSMPTTAGDPALGTKFPLTIAAGIAGNRMRAAAMLTWLQRAHPEVKRIAIVEGDDASGKGYTPAAEEAANARGFQVVSEEFYPVDAKDFAPLVTRVLKQNPDAIDLGTHASVAPNFVGITKALYEQGYRKLMFGVSADVGSWTNGGEMTKNFVVTSLSDLEAPVVGSREKQIAQRYGQLYSPADLEPVFIPDYNIPLILSQALAKAGSVDDTARIMETMRASEWDTIFGKEKFVGAKAYGLPTLLQQPIYLSGIVNGKPATIDVVTGTLD